MGKKNSLSRRGFLKGVLAAGAAPMVVPAGFLHGAGAPSNRVNLAEIGVGTRGGQVFPSLLQPAWVRAVAVSDCFRARRERFAQMANKHYGGKVCEPYADFRKMLERKDIDGVVCTVPDHWHLGTAVLAMQAGKDVYVEKPLTLSIGDNKYLRDAVYRYGRVFQYGTQQRSSTHVRIGCELARSGILGKIRRIEVIAPDGRLGGGSLEPAPVPEGLDYDMWLGPSRRRPYTKDRCTDQASYFSSENSIGFLGGWGAHPLDVMCWALGDGPDSVPVELEATGRRRPGTLFDTFATWRATGRFANGVEFFFASLSGAGWRHWGNDTTFIGENGSISISRNYLRSNPVNLLRSPVAKGIEPLRVNTTGSYHAIDFAQCIKTRERPCSSIDAAYHSDNISHLTRIACLTGRKIRWDIARQEIVGDAEAAAMAQRTPQRAPYII